MTDLLDGRLIPWDIISGLNNNPVPIGDPVPSGHRSYLAPKTHIEEADE